MRGKVRKLTVNINVHATENEEVFKNRINQEFGEGDLKVETLYGHYGDEIKRMTFTLSKLEAEKASKKLLSKLRAFESGYILNEILKGLDRNSLYIRVDKQKFVQGSLELNGDKEVKIIINFYSEKAAKDFLTEKSSETF
ncbi:MAG: hypothetical protein GU362_04645 [Thaumarchaeota archaeon]|jgi:RNA binding exosome subunit|nr:hypothetical protein [Nitrososphaerota archaeon]